MLSIIGFIVILIPLVVVHELGHFLFAKLFNVRADAFSIGFGPVLFHKKLGETDFRVSAIPLGGYVKLLGEDPNAPLSEEEQKRALHHQVPWKRFFIFFGGPLFNFIWAALVFVVMMGLGEPQIATVIGRVLPDTTASRAGLVAGDKVVAIDGEVVSKDDEIAIKLNDKPRQWVTLQIERQGQTLSKKLMTDSEEGFSIYGEKKQVGFIDGVLPMPRMAKIGVSDPQSVAGKAGIKSGEEVISVNGTQVTTFEQIELLSLKSPIQYEIKNQAGEIKKITLPLKNSGLYSAELFVDQVMKDSPAEKAGLAHGDRLVSVSGVNIRSFFELRQQIQKFGETEGKVTIQVERAGKKVDLEIVPQVSTERDPLLKKTKQYTIGVMPVPTMMEPVMIQERILNPLVSIPKATARMIDLSMRNLISIGKMFQGQVSVKSLGGPILIGKLAGDSLSRGIMDFLKMMAILSIGLGVLNILPIPVLDGGHIVLLGIEVIRGRALSLKQIEVAQQVGMALILLIMIVVMKNDISRLPIFN